MLLLLSLCNNTGFIWRKCTSELREHAASFNETIFHREHGGTVITAKNGHNGIWIAKPMRQEEALKIADYLGQFCRL